MAIDYERRKKINKIIYSVIGGIILVTVIAVVILKQRQKENFKEWQEEFTRNLEKQSAEFHRKELEEERAKAIHDSMMLHNPKYRDSILKKDVISKIDTASKWLYSTITPSDGKGRFRYAKIQVFNRSLVAFDNVVVEYSYEREVQPGKAITHTTTFERINPGESKYVEESVGQTRYNAPINLVSSIISASEDNVSYKKIRKDSSKYFEGEKR